MKNTDSGIRELQIAKGLIAVRWAGIPIIFAFSLISKNFFGMSFQIAPIYVLCCILAALNVMFTVHFSMLSRQLMVSKGISGLKRLLVVKISKFFQLLKNDGIRAITTLPVFFLRLASVFYLMLLEALKDVPFNFLSIKNVMHTQIFSDLAIIVLLARFTGSSESPLIFLTVIPITVAGAVMGFRAGAAYSALSVSAYATVCFLINFKMMPHIKFYPPIYGDLSQCSGWIASDSFVIVLALTGCSYLAHKLTLVFKERIYYLNNNLYANKTGAMASSFAAAQTSDAWMILSPDGVIDKVKTDKKGIISANVAGKNIFTAIPELEQYGLAYLLQSVITSNSSKAVDRIKITSKEGTNHIFNCSLSSFKDSDKNTRILFVMSDQTENLFLKEQVAKLTAELTTIRESLEIVTLDGRQSKSAYEEAAHVSNERLVEIEVLNQKLSGSMETERNLRNHISSLQAESACMKSSNDSLQTELNYTLNVLEEMIELLDTCDELENTVGLIESKAKEKFSLDNTCIHVFNSTYTSDRVSEILGARQASPRLLDLPRQNPEALAPVLNEGRPVVIQANFSKEQAASLSIANGATERLTAYVPIRHNGQVLGIMMLERFALSEKPEAMIESLSSYLKYSSAALFVALKNKKLKERNLELNESIAKIYTDISSLKSMILTNPHGEEKPFSKFMFEFGRHETVDDAILVRLHNDQSIEVYSRVDRSKQLELNTVEAKIVETVCNNPNHKATVEDIEDGKELIAYPLINEKKVLGVAIVYHDQNIDESDKERIELCSKVLQIQLSLFVMNEDKELWENFYSKNLLA